MTKKIQDLYSSLQPLFAIFRVCGLAPFEYDAKKHGRFRLSSKSKNYSICVCCLVPTLGLVTYYLKTALVRLLASLRVVLMAAEFSNQLLMYATYGSFLVSSLWHRDKMVAALNSLVDIDSSLLTRPRVVYSRTRKRVCVALLFVSLALGLCETFDFAARSYQIGIARASLLCFSYLVIVCMYVGSLQFMTLILVVKQRLGVVNSEVEDIVTTLRSGSCGLPDYNFTPPRRFVLVAVTPASKMAARRGIEEARLASLRAHHYRLFKAAVTVNEVNALPLLLTLVSTLTNVIVSTHVAMRYLAATSTEGEDGLWLLATAWAKLLWATGYALLAFQLTLVCHVTKREYEHTARLIQDVLYDDAGGRKIDGAVAKQFETFLVQIVNTRLSFSANGFCDVDFGLLCGMAGAVVTYLMILFQIN